MLAAGELRFAFVPSVADEQFRDVIRAIEDCRGDLMRARHRLGKMLLRRGLRWTGPEDRLGAEILKAHAAQPPHVRPRPRRPYREGIEDWVGAGLPVDRPRAVRLSLADLATGPTAALFEGHPRAGVDISIFVVRTPPGRAVELHVHPYAETFLLLEGRGRWTWGEDVLELAPQDVLVVPPG